MSTKVEKKGLHWFTDFLQACYALKDDEDAPCDIETIGVFSLHSRHCKESWVRESFEGKKAKFYKKMVKRLRDTGADDGFDWDSYLRSRKLWITETNCNADDGGRPTSTEACKRITGQVPDYGIGSIQTYMELE